MNGELGRIDTRENNLDLKESYTNIRPEKQMSPRELQDAVSQEFSKVDYGVKNQDTGLDKYSDKTEIGNRNETALSDNKEVGKPIKNKEEGLEREKRVERELKEKYSESEGYEINSEMSLRDENGNIVKDPITGEKRRIDFVVTKGDKVVDSVEVTSPTCDKNSQMGKEQRIRNAGGNYIKTESGRLVEIPKTVQTRVERVDLNK